MNFTNRILMSSVVAITVAVGCKSTPSSTNTAGNSQERQPLNSTVNTTNTDVPFVPVMPVIPNAGSRSSGGPAWDEPQGWERVAPSSMLRRAQYRIPHAENDTVDAELTVTSFGGTVDSNIARWLLQVTRPDGTSLGETSPRVTFTASGYRVTVIESGPGRVSASPRVMAPPNSQVMPTLENGRLLAAVVESPLSGRDSPLWFFKITGPDRTVSQARATFETMLRSIHPPPLPQ